MEYRHNYGEWKNITHDNFEIKDIYLGTISIRVKETPDKFKSDIQVINLLKANDVNLIVKAFENKIIGVDNTMEYRIKNSIQWMPINTLKLTNLKPGTYQIRTKATNQTLASEIHEVNII
ncbi:fibronectin type III domain-containing protein [Metamycoplasma alkalescens]|uniref:fibronectin type III domain-containing protein n=1 Tax=Metamycoplasma alkalescens TaxID=45363 RepID=UPI00039EBB32|nr:fibronectin type III domain-containing protein [Metamycoplasma alkalescens]